MSRTITAADYVLTERPRYDQIRDLYASQLAFVWIGDSTETTRAGFDKRIDSFIEGKLEHVAEMFSTVWEVINKPGSITVPSNSPPAKSVPVLPSLLLHSDVHSTPQVGSGNHESRKLEGREDFPHQVDPRRRFLRQEVLGWILQGWEYFAARLLFKHSHGRQTAAIEKLYVVIRLGFFPSAEGCQRQSVSRVWALSRLTYRVASTSKVIVKATQREQGMGRWSRRKWKKIFVRSSPPGRFQRTCTSHLVFAS